MSELRAPDPTLIDLHEPVGIWHCQPDPAIVHRLLSIGSHTTHCDQRVMDITNSAYAAWFGVPCRTCFPDAPPPGHVHCTTPPHGPIEGCSGVFAVDGLAWQVQP